MLQKLPRSKAEQQFRIIRMQLNVSNSRWGSKYVDIQCERRWGYFRQFGMVRSKTDWEKSNLISSNSLFGPSIRLRPRSNVFTILFKNYSLGTFDCSQASQSFENTLIRSYEPFTYEGELGTIQDFDAFAICLWSIFKPIASKVVFC